MASWSAYSKSAPRNCLYTTITVCSMKCSRCACWISTCMSRVSDVATARNCLSSCSRFHSCVFLAVSYDIKLHCSVWRLKCRVRMNWRSFTASQHIVTSLLWWRWPLINDQVGTCCLGGWFASVNVLVDSNGSLLSGLLLIWPAGWLHSTGTSSSHLLSTTLHWMQRGLCDRKAVLCLSAICLSVTCVYCDKMICLYHMKGNHLVFGHEEWLVGDAPLYLKFWAKLTPSLQKLWFSMDIRS